MQMNRLVMASVGACLVVSAISARAESLKLGEKAPMADVKMKNVDGKELSIADVAGKNGTLVIFSCNHCPYVKAWEGRIAEIGNGYMKKGFGVIAIHSNDPVALPEDSYENIQKRVKERGFEFPSVVDATSDVGRAFGATRTPEAFLFDKDGKLVYHGAIDDNSSDAAKVEKAFLKDALEAVIAGKEIGLKETKAVGCTLKFRSKT